MGEITFYPKGVLKLLNNLNIQKASGSDGLNARVLKECSSEISPMLALIYNVSLAQGALYQMIGGKQMLLRFFRKVRNIMLLIIDRCRSHASVAIPRPRAYNSKQHKQALSFESILADCQHGFRSQMFCEPHLVQFYHDMVSNLDGARDRGQMQTDVIIMDFAKAFYKVPHRRLLYKLDHYGMRGSTHKWISSWLSEGSQKVVLDGQASDPVRVLSGVPQGSVLGLVLFSSSLMIFLIISGQLFASLLMIVCFIGI